MMEKTEKKKTRRMGTPFGKSTQYENYIAKDKKEVEEYL